MPKAQKWPGARGTMMRDMPISRAICEACSGPAPP